MLNQRPMTEIPLLRVDQCISLLQGNSSCRLKQKNVNWEGRKMPVPLTAGEQVDAFERVQSVSNSFYNRNSAPYVLKITKHVSYKDL